MNSLRKHLLSAKHGHSNSPGVHARTLATIATTSTANVIIVAAICFHEFICSTMRSSHRSTSPRLTCTTLASQPCHFTCARARSAARRK
jgi:hypothetical protein